VNKANPKRVDLNGTLLIIVFCYSNKFQMYIAWNDPNLKIHAPMFIRGGFTMKFKKTELENGIGISEWEFKFIGFIFAIADLIRALHEAGII